MVILIFYFSSFFSCLFKTQNIYYQRGIIPHFEGVSEVSLTQLPPNQTKKSLNLYGTPIHEILLITWHVLVPFFCMAPSDVLNVFLAKKRVQIGQLYPWRGRLESTPAYRGFPLCTLVSSPKYQKETTSAVMH